MLTILSATLLFLGLEHSVSGFKACNLYHECESLELADQQFTCYGYESCANAVLIGTDSMPRYMNCDGSDSCINAKLDGFQYMYCQGKNSCNNAIQISADHIECGGYESCVDVKNMVVTRNIYCEGAISCSNIAINSVAVTCNGNKACLQSQIQSVDGITCSGIHSCSNDILVSKLGDITCTGKGACHSSDIDTINIKVYGHFGASYSNINADTIHGMGYYSLIYADIDSMDRKRVRVKSWGHLSGYGAMFICQKGSKCILDCKSTGCNNMDFVCLDGAKCDVIPSECSAMDNIDCPIWSKSVSKQQDDELMEYVEQKKNDRLNDDLYNNALMEFKMSIKMEYDNDSGKYDILDMVFRSFVYSNIFTSFVVFMVTMILSVCYYSMKYKDSIYKQIH